MRLSLALLLKSWIDLYPMEIGYLTWLIKKQLGWPEQGSWDEVEGEME